MVGWLSWMLGGGSLLLAAQSAYSAALSLYAWEDQEKRARSRAPDSFEPPKTSFTILLPAKQEEKVIADTIQRMVDVDYPRQLVQILVILEQGDRGTLAEVDRKLGELRSAGISNVDIITFSDEPVSKPHGLNVGLQSAQGEVVTIFDAEDEPHPQILNLVNTLMVKEGCPVVQSGVQLMNYKDHWFSSLNVLEYYFWFKSRLHYHSTRGMIPLGGNTVFMRREVIEKLGGWDDYCLTEDADIGIRLSAARVPIRVVHDDRYVTREETPHTIGEFVKQRTRWDQGFLQILSKPYWRMLPTRSQRMLALYTLAFPMFQALMIMYLPVSGYTMFFAKVPVLVAMMASLPLYMLAIQMLITLIGLYEFSRAHVLRAGPLSGLRLIVSFLPYQWLLAYSALRALVRHIIGVNTWEKTTHIGAHRSQMARAEPRA